MHDNQMNWIFREPNFQKIAYLGINETSILINLGFCFHVLFTGFNTFQNLIIVVLEKLGFKTLGQICLGCYYFSASITYLFVGPIMVSKIKSKYRGPVMSLGTLGYLSFTLSSMNVAWCTDQEFDEQNDHSVLFQCDENFIQFLLVVTSFLGGFGSAILWHLQSLYMVRCARPWTRSRMNGVFFTIYLSNLVSSSCLNIYVVPHISLYNYQLVICLICLSATVLFIFVIQPNKWSPQMEKEKLTNIEDLTEEELFNLVQTKGRHFTEEQNLLSAIKSSNKKNQKLKSLQTFTLRIKGIYRFLKTNHTIKLLLPKYFYMGLMFSWWIQISVLIVTIFEQKSGDMSVKAEKRYFSKVGEIQLVAGACQFLFGNIWGGLFDRFDQKQRKYLLGMILFFSFIYIFLTIIGESFQNYDLFYVIAIFYGISLVGLRVTSGPIRSVNYSGNDEHMLYSYAIFQFLYNITTALGFFSGVRLVLVAPFLFVFIMVLSLVYTIINLLFRDLKF